MRARPPVPPPPQGPATRNAAEASCRERFWRDDRYPPSLAARNDESLDLYTSGLSETDDSRAFDTLLRSIRLRPHTKTAYHLSRRAHAQGDAASALGFAGLAYALNPRHDQSAVNLAQLLADLGAPERAWEIVGETLTRNPSYEPAWALLESLEAQR